MAEVRTRFAPSPTGFLHIGGLRTAAYAYALAKHNQGKFLLRIEDTDQKREVEGATQKIYDILKLFKLDWDEGPLVGGPHEPYIQSLRLPSKIYSNAAAKLLEEGHAFYCFCKPLTKEEIKANQATKKIQFRDPCRKLTPQEIQHKLDAGEQPAIRLKVPDNEKISYKDFVLGKKNEWRTDFVDDAMLLKSDGFPTYHLAMPVDDHDMQISHVIRTSEWQSSTPIHLLVFKFLGFEPPLIGHPTAILDPEGGKLSKRKGNVSVEQFLEDGYLPEALLNFVILLGWAPKDNQEFFSLEEFVTKFDENGFQKSNPQFNIQKLSWFNGQWMRRISFDDFYSRLLPFLPKDWHADTRLKDVATLIQSRIATFKEAEPLIKFFFEEPTVSPELEKSYLDEVVATLEKSDWNKESIEDSLLKLVEQKGHKKADFFMALRLAVCGARITPPLTESMLILGKETVLTRLRNIT